MKMEKVKMIGLKPAMNWLKNFALMVHSSKAEEMNDEDKNAIDDIVTMIKNKIKEGVIVDDDISYFKDIAKPLQAHEALNKYERLKYLSAELQLTQIRYYNDFS